MESSTRIAEPVGAMSDPSEVLVAKGDREMIEDLLPAAFNDAQRKTKEMHAEAMQSIAGGLPIAGLQDALSQLSNSGDEPTDK